MAATSASTQERSWSSRNSSPAKRALSSATIQHLVSKRALRNRICRVSGVRDCTQRVLTFARCGFRGLGQLRDALGPRFAAGIILTTGTRSYTYADRLHVMPIDRLWTPVTPGVPH